MPPIAVLPLLCGLLSLGFTAVLAACWVAQRRPYYGVWAIGLACYGLSTAAEAVGASGGWTTVIYRVWYAAGAIGVAAYLGAGSVFLHREPALRALVVVGIALGSVPALLGGYALVGAVGLIAALTLGAVLARAPAQFARATFGLLVAASLAAAALIAVVPLDATALPRADQIATGQAFPAEVRILTPMFNVPGALALFLGAIASGIGYWRTRSRPGHVVSNVLIAVGALVPSLTSGLTRFGLSSAFYVGELVGVLCILAGFVLSGATIWLTPARRAAAHRPGSSDPRARQ